MDGEEAIKKYMEHKDKIQLLLFDVIMPGKNGKQAYEEIKKVSPVVKALFMSGYSADFIQVKKIFEKNMNYIQKPISTTEFLKKVREILDK